MKQIIWIMYWTCKGIKDQEKIFGTYYMTGESKDSDYGKWTNSQNVYPLQYG